MASTLPARMHAERGFGKRLDPHDTGQHGRAVDAVIVQERLSRRIERGLHGQTTVESHARDLADHRPVRGNRCSSSSGQRYGVEPTGLVPFVQHDAETLADDDFATGASSGQFAANHGTAGFGRQHVDACQFHHLGDGAARGHADAAPRRPVDDDAARAGRVVRKLDVILHSRSLAAL